MIRARALTGWLNLVLGGLLMLAAWVLLVFVTSRPALKHLFDFSPQQEGTVSSATEELLREIRAEGLRVEFHTFFAPLGPSPQGNEVARHHWSILKRLQDLTYNLLRRYAYLGGEAVIVKHHDLQNDIQQTREYAEKFNVTSDRMVVVVVGGRHKKLELEGDLALIDIPGTSVGGGSPGPGRNLPLLKDYKGEEALSSALKGLLVQGTPVIYFLTGFREGDRTGRNARVGVGYGALQQALQADAFDIRELNLGELGAVPDDASMVVLLEPKSEITERDAQALADYVRRGGRLFLNFSYSTISSMNPRFEALGKLLGFEVGGEVIYHPIPHPNDLTSPGLDGDPGVQKLRVFQVNPNHPITFPLARANRGAELAACRELRKRSDAPEDVRPDPSLLVSGPYAWLAVSRVDGEVPSYWAPKGNDRFQSRCLGMVIDVDVATAGGDNGGGDGAPAPEVGHVVLIGGMAFNNAGFPLNRDLGLNIFNWLTERKALVSVRSKSYQAKYLEVVPQQLDRVALLLVAGVPGALLLLGLLVFWRRSRI